MKKRNIVFTILFLSLAACSLGLVDFPVNTSSASQLAVVHDQVQMTPDPIESKPLLTDTPITTSTTLPSPTPTLPVDEIVERPYDPGEWKMLYDKYTVEKIELDPTGSLWITPGRKVGYFDVDRWVFLSLDECRFFNHLGAAAIAPDGMIWILEPHAFSRYQDGHWDTFPLPKEDETARTEITIDASGAVWAIMSARPSYEYYFEKFDGKNWSKVQLWASEGSIADPPTFLFTPDGGLWAVEPYTSEIGRYDGKTWKIYSETNLWAPQYWVRYIQITSDPKGNIYGVSSGQSGHTPWITKIDTEGQVSKIPFPTSLTFNSHIIRLFVDSEDTIWVNACLDERFDDTCLAYYKDNQWVSFTDLPTNSMMLDMKELSDGTYLIATHQGVYEFNPEW